MIFTKRRNKMKQLLLFVLSISIITGCMDDKKEEPINETILNEYKEQVSSLEKELENCQENLRIRNHKDSMNIIAEKEKLREERVRLKKENEKLKKEQANKKNNQTVNKKNKEKKHTLPWYTNVEEAIKISRETGKPLFFFFTGSDWCGWCIRLQKEVFFKPEFEEWAKNSVILVELDFPKRTKLDPKIQQQNRQLAQMFGVRGYPTVWFVTPEFSGGKTNFNKLGSQGYVAGGPTAWIAGANKILSNAK